ncbi:titin-like [Branchiostoma floridae]|uniref:Titin-like n=1 Tax=Branchiostoma floridae TaxID=7739 RepID=A0A9J7HLW9_BRAFL|nr:titin-like [Branchiostoma floridae]XP_035660612.1 titin-like [Branchiostoma floridae]
MELRPTSQRRQKKETSISAAPILGKGRQARPSQEEANARKRMKTTDLREGFNVVVTEMSADWRELGHRLGLTHDYIEATDQKHQGKTPQCCREVLEQWRKESGSQATLKMLEEVLRKARHVRVADMIKCIGDDSESPIASTSHTPGTVEVVKTTESWIKIKWAPPTICMIGTLIGYIVEHSFFQTDEWVKAHDQGCLPSSTTEFKVGGLTKNGQYHFRVKAVYRGRKLSEPSYSGLGIAKIQGQPLQPRNLRVTDLDTKGGIVMLEWLEPEEVNDGDFPITSYIVEKRLHSDWVLCLKTSKLQCTIKGITDVEDWRFRVSAKNKKGLQSDPSEMVNPEVRIKVDVHNAGQANREAVKKALWKSAFEPHGLSGKKIEEGSIVFVYSCRDPIGLCNLWMMYCRGEVCQYFQKLLVTENVLRTCSTTDVKLVVTIDPEDFRASGNHLLLTRETKHGYRVLSKSLNTDLFCLINNLASFKGKTTMLTQENSIADKIAGTSNTNSALPGTGDERNQTVCEDLNEAGASNSVPVDNESSSIDGATMAARPTPTSAQLHSAFDTICYWMKVSDHKCYGSFKEIEGEVHRYLIGAAKKTESIRHLFQPAAAGKYVKFE